LFFFLIFELKYLNLIIFCNKIIINYIFILKNKKKFIFFLITAIFAGNTIFLKSDDFTEQNNNLSSYKENILNSKKGSSKSIQTYILGAGDTIKIEMTHPALDETITIGPDGTIQLPLIQSAKVEGLTFSKLRLLLIEKYKTFVLNPEIYVSPVSYRPVRVHVSGEVNRPGFYIVQADGRDSSLSYFPTVFDAIKTAEGITLYSDLEFIEVIREVPFSHGGGKIRTVLNFNKLLSEGDLSHNISIQDGDKIFVKRSKNKRLNQLIMAGLSNLNPEANTVYVGGHVEAPGDIVIPPGTTLNQALIIAGGTKALRGKAEFVRFKKDGDFESREFSINKKAVADSKYNPVLQSGDLIFVNSSILEKTTTVIDIVASPFIGVFSAFKLFQD